MAPAAHPREPAAASPALGPAIDREVRRSKRLLGLFLGLAALPILLAAWVLVFGKSGLQQVTEEVGSQMAEGLGNFTRLEREVELQTARIRDQQQMLASASATIQSTADASAQMRRAVQLSESLAAELSAQSQEAKATAASVRDLKQRLELLASDRGLSERSNWVSAAEFRDWQKTHEAQRTELTELAKAVADLTPRLKRMDDFIRTTTELQQTLQRLTNLEVTATGLERRLQRLERRAVLTR